MHLRTLINLDETEDEKIDTVPEAPPIVGETALESETSVEVKNADAPAVTETVSESPAVVEPLSETPGAVPDTDEVIPPAVSPKQAPTEGSVQSGISFAFF